MICLPTEAAHGLLNATLSTRSAETTYKVNVTTGDVLKAGTDANVFLIIFGENGDSGEIALKDSETYKDKFERNHTDVFTLKNLLSLGRLHVFPFSHCFLPGQKLIRDVAFLNS